MPAAVSPMVDLQYVTDNTLKIQTVPRAGVLGDLTALSDKLAERYRWHPGPAALFVLTGARPIVSIYSASAQVRYGTYSGPGTRVTLTLDPFMTAQQVAEVYSDLRSRLQPPTPRRAQSLKSYRLAEHVAPYITMYLADPAEHPLRGRPRQPDPVSRQAWYIEPTAGSTWRELQRSWNQRYSERGEDGKRWQYDQASNFIRHAQDAVTRLLDPGWRRTPAPTAPPL